VAPKAKLNRFGKILPIISLAILSAEISTAQDLRFGVYLSPAITWFSTDITEVNNQGSRTGLIFVVNAERTLGDHFAVTGGISFLSTGGRLVSRDAEPFRFRNYTAIVAADEPVVYRIQYLSIPAGIKVRSKEIGSLTIFSDIGFDPKIVIRGLVDVPSLDVEGENGMGEIKRFNFGWHIHGGIEYPLGGRTAAVLGLGFENNFPDITKDAGSQVNDRVAHKFLKFIFGINF